MNKQQAYFEKEIVPYRQRIRNLEREVNEIRLENHTYKSMNADLRSDLKNKELQIEKLQELLEISDEDRVRLFKHLKSSDNIDSIMKAFGKAFSF